MSTTIKFEHEAQVKEETYKKGNFFIIRGNLYVLTANGSKAAMAQVNDGHLYEQVAYVGGPENFDVEAITKLAGTTDWVRVSVEITTKPFQP